MGWSWYLTGADNALITETAENVSITRQSPITVIHGGGNTEVDGERGGDTITVTGNGEGHAPVIIYGDTSQDGSRFAEATGVASTRAVAFDNYGDDIIDASAASTGVVIYGGRGNDVLTGSQGDDHIAGGSGNDLIMGQAGNDHIYGDSGFNNDLTERLDLAAQVLTVVTVANPQTDGVNSDDLTVGNDEILGGADNDIIFGDHGVIEQQRDGTPATLRLMTTGNVTAIYSDVEEQGVDDVIAGNEGDDIVLAGHGEDVVTGEAGNDILIGDFALLDYLNDGDTDLATLDLIQIRNTALGSNDQVSGHAGDDIIAGGTGRDSLYGADSSGVTLPESDNDLIVGDFADIILVAGQVTRIASTEPNSGDNDTIHGAGGNNRIIAGFGDDLVEANEGDDHIIGDNGYLVYDENGLLAEAVTTELTIGGVDTLLAGDGNNVVLGGLGGDTIETGDGDDSVLGDNGVMIFIDGIRSRLETVDANGGNDQIILGDGDDQVIAGVGDDTVSSTGGENVMLGDIGYILSDLTGRYTEAATGDPTLGGSDSLVGGDNRDILFGGVAGDTVDGAAGDDLLVGDAGKVTRTPTTIILETTDFFVGGIDTITGGPGLDRIIAGFAGDNIYGNLADDVIVGEYARYTFTSDPDGEQATVIVTLAQDNLDLARLTDQSLYTFQINVDQLPEVSFINPLGSRALTAQLVRESIDGLGTGADLLLEISDQQYRGGSSEVNLPSEPPAGGDDDEPISDDDQGDEGGDGSEEPCLQENGEECEEEGQELGEETESSDALLNPPSPANEQTWLVIEQASGGDIAGVAAVAGVAGAAMVSQKEQAKKRFNSKELAALAKRAAGRRYRRWDEL